MPCPAIPTKDRETVACTPNLNCPACQEMRRHTEAETAAYHPFSGHGFTKEMGRWTHPDLP